MSQEQDAQLTTAEVARRLYISEEGVRQLIKRGILPAQKPGRDYLVLESDLQKEIERRKDKYARSRNTP